MIKGDRWQLMRVDEQSMEVNENRWKLLKIGETSIKIVTKVMKIDGNR